MTNTVANGDSYDDAPRVILPIHDAAKSGDCSLLRSTLSSLNINARDPMGCSPLHLAAAANKPDAVRLLLENGADHELKGPYDTSNEEIDDASTSAVRQNAVDALKELLDFGITFPDNAFLVGSSCGSLGCIKLMLEHLLGPHPSVGHERHSLLERALSFAAQEWRPRIVELLLQSSPSSYNQLDEESGITSLNAAMHALCNTNERVRDMQYLKQLSHASKIVIPWDEALDVVHLLVNAGAIVNSRDRRSLETPLSMFCSPTWISLPSPLIQLLIERGADPNIPSHDGRTPLMGALEMASTDSDNLVVKALLEAGANPVAIDDQGNLPLHFVSSRETAEILLGNGANATARNKQRETPLHLASCRGAVGAVEYLLSHCQGVEVNGKTRTGWTPLVYAPGSESSFETIKILLLHGADINTTTSQGWTVLHRAAQEQNLSVIKILLENGADVNATATSGLTRHGILGDRYDDYLETCRGFPDGSVSIKSLETPLHWASEGQCSDTVDWLLQYGADIEARDSTGSTPLLRALKKRGTVNIAVVNSLLRHGADQEVTDTEGHNYASMISAQGFEATREGLLQHKPPPFRGNRIERGRGAAFFRGRTRATGKRGAKGVFNDRLSPSDHNSISADS